MEVQGIPMLQRTVLNRWRELAYATIVDVYTNQILGAGRSSPPYTTGRWLNTLQIYVSPQLSWVTVRQAGLMAMYTEMGRPPGPVPIRVIMDWMNAKWGFTERRIARSIARKVSSQGYVPHRIMFNSFDISTPKGRQMQQDMMLSLDIGTDLLLRDWQ